MGTHVFPTWLPDIHLAINKYLAFDLNFATIWAVVNLLYYYILEPTAAVCLISHDLCILSHDVLPIVHIHPSNDALFFVGDEILRAT